MDNHTWVSMQYTPLIVEKDESGTLIIEAGGEALKVAEEEAMMGCWFCHVPLQVESFDTTCEPELVPQNNAQNVQTDLDTD